MSSLVANVDDTSWYDELANPKDIAPAAITETDTTVKPKIEFTVSRSDPAINQTYLDAVAPVALPMAGDVMYEETWTLFTPGWLTDSSYEFTIDLPKGVSYLSQLAITRLASNSGSMLFKAVAALRVEQALAEIVPKLRVKMYYPFTKGYWYTFRQVKLQLVRASPLTLNLLGGETRISISEDSSSEESFEIMPV